MFVLSSLIAALGLASQTAEPAPLASISGYVAGQNAFLEIQNTSADDVFIVNSDRAFKTKPSAPLPPRRTGHYVDGPLLGYRDVVVLHPRQALRLQLTVNPTAERVAVTYRPPLLLQELATGASKSSIYERTLRKMEHHLAATAVRDISVVITRHHAKSPPGGQAKPTPDAEFHFPKVLGPPGAEHLSKSAIDALPPEQAAVIREMERKDAVLYGNMQRDINATAKGLVARVAESKGAPADLLMCGVFCSAVVLRISDHVELVKETATELRRFCQASLAPVTPSAEYIARATFDLKMQIIRCDITLREDAAAKSLAEQLLKENARQGYFVDGQVDHDANMILAEVAFRSHDLKGACERLHLAGQTKGSPVLGSFGPRFPLILDLLTEGRHAAVVDYLRGISRFWNKSTVEGWIKTIQAGGTPAKTGEWQSVTDPHPSLGD